MKAYMKETSEPLVQQYRELAAVVRNFIQLKRDNRVRWYEVEPIFLYYKKYLNMMVKKPYDFEGEKIPDAGEGFQYVGDLEDGHYYYKLNFDDESGFYHKGEPDKSEFWEVNKWE